MQTEERIRKLYEHLKERKRIKLNSIDNDSTLFSILDNMQESEKEELEEAIIGLTLREEISKEENNILNKYKNYVMKKSNKNIMEYLNNNYLSFLYHKEFEKIVKDSNYDSQINQKSIWEIYQELCDKFNEISAKLENNTKLTNEEHKFFKNNIENRQLYILYNLSKQLLKINVDSIITFDRYHNEEDIRCEGFYKKLSDGRYKINISNLEDIYLKDEKTMYESLFTVFHELGHLMQEINNDAYPKEIQELFKWEKYIINKDNSFYKHFKN